MLSLFCFLLFIGFCKKAKSKNPHKPIPPAHTPPLRLPKLLNLPNLRAKPLRHSPPEKYFAFYLQIVEMFSNFARIFADDAITLNYINN